MRGVAGQLEELHGASPSSGLCFLISENSEMLPEGKAWVNICPDVETGQIRQEDERDMIQFLSLTTHHKPVGGSKKPEPGRGGAKRAMEATWAWTLSFQAEQARSEDGAKVL